MIKIEVNGVETVLRFNTSMRKNDFAKLNSLSGSAIDILFARCHEKMVIATFLSIKEEDVRNAKLSCVLKHGNYRKKIVVTADGGLLKAEDSHLLDTYLEKQKLRAAKVQERGAMWKARKMLELSALAKEHAAVEESNATSPIEEVLND